MSDPYRQTVIEAVDWREVAACRGMNVDTFFLFQHERGHERRVHEMAAKAVCARCPVAQRCLDWAVSTQQAYGIWGGATNLERGVEVPG